MLHELLTVKNNTEQNSNCRQPYSCLIHPLQYVLNVSIGVKTYFSSQFSSRTLPIISFSLIWDKNLRFQLIL